MIMNNENRERFGCRQCDCKYYKGQHCSMADEMETEHRDWFVHKGSCGCYYYDSIREG